MKHLLVLAALVFVPFLAGCGEGGIGSGTTVIEQSDDAIEKPEGEEIPSPDGV